MFEVDYALVMAEIDRVLSGKDQNGEGETLEEKARKMREWVKRQQ